MKFLCLLIVLVRATSAQIPGPADVAEAKKQTVMISSRIGDTDLVGAGVMFATANDRIYIVTANHLLRDGSREAKSSDVKVEFAWLSGEPFEPRILNHYDDRALGIAVLTVPNFALTQAMAHNFRADRLGQPAELREGAPIWALGYPNGNKWELSPAADLIRVDAITIRTRSPIGVGKGYSGGPLLDKDGKVVGIVQRESEGTRIDLVMDQLRRWDLPVHLTSTATPVSTPPKARQPVDAQFSAVLNEYIAAAKSRFAALELKSGRDNMLRKTLPGANACAKSDHEASCAFHPRSGSSVSELQKQIVEKVAWLVSTGFWKHDRVDGRDRFTRVDGTRVEVQAYPDGVVVKTLSSGR